jgi:neutral trehalase
VNDTEHVLFRYGTGGTGPRPESYREDVELGDQFSDPAERESFYFHMKAGAESGWDYSTRWMINNEVSFIFFRLLSFFDESSCCCKSLSLYLLVVINIFNLGVGIVKLFIVLL